MHRPAAAPRAVAGAVVLAAVLAAAPAAPAATPKTAALTPFTANVTAALGVRPVAIGQTLGGNDRFSSRLAGVPRLTLSHPFGPNVEQLALKDPRLVLSAPVWRKGAKRMRSFGMRVVEVDPRAVTQVPRAVRQIGSLLGRSAAAQRLARRMEARIHAATRNIRKRPRVLLVLGVGRASYAMLPSSWGGDVVQRAGGRLLTSGLRGSGYVRISDEFVVRRNPQVIIAIPHGSASSIPAQARALRSKGAFRRTAAGRTGRIHVATGNSLLQAYDDVDRTIRDVRAKYLKN